jgi:hypothetical protein
MTTPVRTKRKWQAPKQRHVQASIDAFLTMFAAHSLKPWEFNPETGNAYMSCRHCGAVITVSQTGAIGGNLTGKCKYEIQ